MLKTVPYCSKFGGATGNFNAHFLAYPKIDWNKFAKDFQEKTFGLKRSYPTTQIEHYDDLAALFDNLRRINTILIDLCRDMVIIGNLMNVDLVNFNILLTYLLPLIPVFIYFVFKANEVIILKSNAPVPLNKPHFGEMNIIIFALVVFIALIALNILIDPLAKIFPMPEALKRIYAQMSNRSVWSFLSIAICAPIIEETYLRGMSLALQKAAMRKLWRV